MQEKRSKELQTKLVTLLFITITYCVIRNISILSNSAINDYGEMFKDVATFTGMQLNKISLFSLGITPYMLSTMVIGMMKINILPDVKRFLENPNNKSKVDKIEYAIFLFYSFLHTQLLYSNLSVWHKVLLIIGAIVLRIVANNITKLGLVNGLSYLLGVSILLETVSSLKSASFFVGMSSLLVIVVLSVVFCKSGQWLSVQYYENGGNKFETDIPVPLSLAGVTPLFYSSLCMTILEGLLEYVDMYNQTVVLSLYVVFICFFTVRTFLKTMNPKAYANNLIIKGYSLATKEQSYNGYVKEIRRVVLRTSLFSSLALCAFTIIPIVLNLYFDFVIPVSACSVILLISIFGDLFKAVRYYGIKTNYQTILA